MSLNNPQISLLLVQNLNPGPLLLVQNSIIGDPRSFNFMVIPVVLSSSGGELMMDVNACFTAAGP